MNPTLRAVTVLVFALALCPATDAEAQRQQQFPEIRIGQTVNGTLVPADPAMAHRGRFKVYRFTARDDQRYVVNLRSDDFDAFLTLMRPVGGITDAIRSDDDGGEGTDSRMRFRVPESGTYLLVAQSLMEDGLGAFSLTLEQAPPPRPAQVQPLQVGTPVRGRLTESDAAIEDHDYDDREIFYQLYTFHGQAGQQFEFAMDSDEFDAYLQFGPLRGNDIEVTDWDDDGGEGTNALLRVRLPETGTYGIRARSFGAEQVGTYTLSAVEWTPRPAVRRPIARDQAVTASLTRNDAENDRNAYYQEWTYTGRANETVHVTMTSDEFDTYLRFGRMRGGEFEELAYNDDGYGMGTDSYLEYTLPAAGEYVIHATSFGSGRTGEYTLRAGSAPR